MSFHSPLVLLGLLALAPAVWLYVRRERADRARAFAPAPLLPSVAPRRPRWRRHAPIAVYGVALAVLVVALARPQTTVAVPVDQATIVVATDRSGSMLATDVKPTRLAAARRAALAFVDAVPGRVRIGALAFNGSAQVLQSPTRDHEAVREAIDGIHAGGSTATGEALGAALTLLRSSRTPGAKHPPEAIVLLSDGKSVRGRDPVLVAGEARRAGVPVYTVALGTAAGVLESRTASGSVRRTPVPPDPATLAKIAQASGGQSFAVKDAKRLQAVYERIGSKVTTEHRKREVTSMFAGGALLLLVAGAASSLRWFGRVV